MSHGILVFYLRIYKLYKILLHGIGNSVEELEHMGDRW